MQVAYNDKTDRSVKIYTLMISSLAYVPTDDVAKFFKMLKREAPADLALVFTYFEENYVIGIPRRGRRNEVQPRYPIATWNQYEAALVGSHKTNNCSEGWHNRFRLVVGKNHPDLFSLLKELQKEQADSDIIVTELRLGRSVKAAPKKKWINAQNNIRHIVADYATYKTNNQILQYLRSLASNVFL